VSDFSLDLLNGICLSFNECRPNTFICKCFFTLSLEKQMDLPRCFIRFHIAHLLKIIWRKIVFKGKLPNVKDFYVRCIGVATTSDKKETFEEIIKAMLIVALSESSGEDEYLSTYTNEKYLLTRIATFSARTMRKMIFCWKYRRRLTEMFPILYTLSKPSPKVNRRSAILRTAGQTPIICPNWCHYYWNCADTVFYGLK